VSTIEVAGAQIDTRHYINGERVESESTYENTSPIDGSFLGNISRGGKREVDLAVAAAKAAFPAWSRLGAKGRGEKLLRLAELVEENLEILANVETLDNGSLLRSHRRGVMPRVAMNIRFFATGQSTNFTTNHSTLVVTPTTSVGTLLESQHSLLHGMHHSCWLPGRLVLRSPLVTPLC